MEHDEDLGRWFLNQSCNAAILTESPESQMLNMIK
jgi:hypothetical protein